MEKRGSGFALNEGCQLLGLRGMQSISVRHLFNKFGSKGIPPPKKFKMLSFVMFWGKGKKNIGQQSGLYFDIK